MKDPAYRNWPERFLSTHAHEIHRAKKVVRRQWAPWIFVKLPLLALALLVCFMIGKFWPWWIVITGGTATGARS